MIYKLFDDFYFVINVKNKEFMVAFGKNLKKLRKEVELTQEDLANDCNISLSQIGRIERGEINTTISTLYVLAKALDIEVAELFKF
ncbi:helix-turn-helix domain-containing protein [Tenacibaculum sp. Mcav3-52]|uniref:helix-turn-helix domain-containing protein n=1 Tax=Tenacibaculum sp. Mcav3-52 TaxID=2917762 RepID=UPI001EF23290|nr:helix-turn-helix transcriptional regulator [Tenacibaculum sp. Mcav3-52]MCG7501765.1 helix-turn-helix domain-containing protein [Tenacibaculum sp. Mcav3-52]